MSHYQKVGTTSIDERPIVKSWVLRRNNDGSEFNGKEFDATITVEENPKEPEVIYVGVAISKDTSNGCINAMIKDCRPFFKAMGYTHADYKIGGKLSRVEL